MLNYELTPNHTGFVLWGDYATLKRLHEFVHKVVEESILIEDKEGFILGLAYDARKAFEEQRRESYMDYGGDRNKIFGVEILWPVILIQVGVLRHAMAFMISNRLDQATMFELEHVVELAARAAMPSTADEIIHSMYQTGAMPYQHIDAVLNSRCCYFIELPAQKRLSILPKLMETFDPMYEFIAKQNHEKRPAIISPIVFAEGDREWPDFDW
jgi:hypothetical protein